MGDDEILPSFHLPQALFTSDVDARYINGTTQHFVEDICNKTVGII